MVAPAAPAAREETGLPIGKPLTILNENQSFEETLKDISQPLSADANLLHAESSMPAAPAQPAPALSGTPLVKNMGLRTSTPPPKNRVQEVVAQQWRVTRNDPPAEPLPAGVELKTVQNPVEEACSALKAAWPSEASHEQLISLILSLPGMKASLETALHGTARTTPLAMAASRYLQDLEAERLAALVELDKAKADTEEFRRACVAESNDRVRAEMTKLQESRDALSASVEEIKAQINTLSASRDALQRDVDQIRHGALPESLSTLLMEGGLSLPAATQPLRLNPAVGTKLSLEDMLHRIELACNACGAAYDRNRMIVMLVLLAVSPCIGVTAPSAAAVSTLGSNLIRALGWQKAYAHQTTVEQKAILTPAPADAAPAILLTSLSLYSTIPGLTKIFYAHNALQMIRNSAYEADPWPIFPINQLPFIMPDAVAEGMPVSKESLQAMCEIHPADEATVGMALRPIMEKTTILSGAAYRAMVRFASASAGLLEGGLAAACDWAILLWLIPAVDRRNTAALTELLQEYPLSSAALNVRN